MFTRYKELKRTYIRFSYTLLFFSFPLLLLAQTQRETDALLDRVDSLQNTAQYDSAEVLVDRAFQLASEQNYTAGIHRSLLERGVTARLQGDFRTATSHYINLSSRLQQGTTSNDSLLAVTQNELAWSYFRLDSAEACIDYTTKSLQLSQELADSALINLNLYQLADCHISAMDLAPAANYAYQALQMAEQRQDTQRISASYHQLAILRNQEERYREAVDYFQQGLRLAKQRDDQWGQMGLYNDMGIAYRKMGLHDSARVMYQQSAFLADSLSFDYALTIIRPNESKNEYQSGNARLALQIARDNKELVDQIGPESSQASLRCFEALSLLELGQTDEALRVGETALDYYDRISNMEVKLDIYDALYRIYKARGASSKALYFLENFEAVADSINEARDESRINQLEIQYAQQKQKADLLQKESRIEVLQEKQQEQRSQNFTLLAAMIGLLLGSASFIFFQYRQRISSQRLMQQRTEELEKLDRMKNDFFMNLAHELRTPLTLIISPLQDVLQTSSLDLPVWARNNLLRARQNSEKLQQLVEEVLDLSRLDNQKLTLNNTITALSSLLAGILSSFQPVARARGIDLQQRIDLDSNALIEIDSSKLEKMVNNLLDNALKFTPAGGTVLLEASRHDDQALHIAVTDSGPGIPVEELDKIFNRYYQSNANLRPLSGTGIGLALVSEFAALMGGSIQAKNVSSGGARFDLSLPYRAASQPHHQIFDRDAEEQREVLEGGTYPLEALAPGLLPNRPKLLVVEDDHELRRYLVEILESQYEIVSVENGQAAYEVLCGCPNPPALILSDMMMPLMGGMELLKRVRQMNTTIPFLLLTARNEMKDKLRALSIGVDDYLTKPFHTSELLVRIRNLVYFRYLALQARKEAQEPKDITQQAQGSAENSQPATILSRADTEWLQKISDILRSELENTEFTRDKLAQRMSISERQLSRRLKQITGMPPSRYFREIRLHQAKDFLEEGTFRTVAEVSYAVGFDTPHYFTKLFYQRFGRRPSSYFTPTHTG